MLVSIVESQMHCSNPNCSESRLCEMKSAIFTVVWLCLTPISLAQESTAAAHKEDFSQVVFPITTLSIEPSLHTHFNRLPGVGEIIKGGFGSGFCLDRDCLFVVTNYHVAKLAAPKRIKRDKIVARYLATGPKDRDVALTNRAALPYAPKRDLAVFRLKHPLKGHHGIGFDLEPMDLGQQVDVYGYPLRHLNPFRKLAYSRATVLGLNRSGLLILGLEDTHDPWEGASGGIVVNEASQKIVGVVSEGDLDNRDRLYAVPVQNLADFFASVEPYFASEIFPHERGAETTDLLPPFQPPPDVNARYVPPHESGLERRTEEPPAVTALRQHAQMIADNMRDYIVVQSMAFGRDNKLPAMQTAYEVRVLDGKETFRDYPNGKKLRTLPRNPVFSVGGAVIPSDDWAGDIAMLGTEMQLKIHQAPDAVVNGQKLHVFQFWAALEDGVCSIRPVDYWGFFTISHLSQVPCYGEVWTDQQMNIVRMSQHMDLSARLKRYQGWDTMDDYVRFGWRMIGDETRQLVPVSYVRSGKTGKHVYWTVGQYTQYQVFGSRSKILALEK